MPSNNDICMTHTRTHTRICKQRKRQMKIQRKWKKKDVQQCLFKMLFPPSKFSSSTKEEDHTPFQIRARIWIRNAKKIKGTWLMYIENIPFCVRWKTGQTKTRCSLCLMGWHPPSRLGLQHSVLTKGQVITGLVSMPEVIEPLPGDLLPGHWQTHYWLRQELSLL